MSSSTTKREAVPIDLAAPAEGLEALTRARREAPGAALVAIVSDPSSDVVRLALEAGADACALAAEGPAYELAVAEAVERRRAVSATAPARALADENRRLLELLVERAPLSAILADLCRVVEAHVPGSLCSVLTVDGDGILRHGAAPSLPGAFTRVVEGQPIGPSAGSCGTAAFRGQAVVAHDIERDPLWTLFRPLAAEHGLRACWSTPVLDRRRHVIATFAVYHREPYSPSERDLAIVELFARCVGIAVEREREEARRAAAERSAEAQRAVAAVLACAEDMESALPRILRAIGEGLGWDLAAVFLVEGAHLRCAAQWRGRGVSAPRFEAASRAIAFADGVGLPGRIRATAAPAWIEDVGTDPSFVRAAPATAEGIRSGFGLPILEGDEVLGVLELYSRERRRRDGELLLGTFAGIGGQLGQSIRRWRAEAERTRLLRAAEDAGRAKDEFLAILSHELRTPLTSILGWARLLKDGKLEAPAAQRGLDALARNAQTQARLINDILDVSRIIAGKLTLQLEPIPDLAALVEKVVESFQPEAAQKRLALSLDVDSGGPVLGDPERLQQVVRNLVANAVKFTPAEGSIRVRVARVGAHLEVEVRDTGQGMPAEFIPRAFDRFAQADTSATRRASGLGLGLALVKHLIELHGGAAGASSAGPGRGSVFTVRVPVATGTVGAAPPAAAEPTPSLAGVRVLAVEDNADVVGLVVRVLEDAGATVRSAGSVAEGLALAASHPADVILVDMRLPDGDGFDLARSLRAQGYAGPIAALTADALAVDRRRALEAGFDTHLAKPVEPAALVRELAALVARPAAPGLRRLLIVDDDADTADVLRTMVAHPAVECHVCSDGAAAADRARALRPHVIVLDQMLPGRTGFDVFLELRTAAFAPRIILLSAHATAETFAVAEDLGAYGCLRKPFDAGIRATILSALGVEDAVSPPPR